ncbi:nucleotide exchange factor GrpE [Clostridium massiliodielmoense]|uniref:nucleotide exchange factor GrpE n=1 Tax=Clostridium massiliodielmoense TaxID=1776385 RepID=UPI0004D88A33|nr:nucleotide exchange factor GrpE [Clostridium massiliodielmoense]KEH99106.1 molecular chaperone GrpE [Clostridium botulinum C/D str. BKT12695]
MFSIKEELKSFKTKSINTYNEPLNDINDILDNVQKKMNNIDKASKKNAMSMEVLNEEIKEKNNQIITLRRDLNYKNKQQKEFIIRFINMLDEIDNIINFANQTENNELIKNVKSVKSIIKKNLYEIGIEEIPTVGEKFNEKLHECVQTISDDRREKYEILEVIKPGYKFNNEVIRVASVVAAK